MRELPTIESLAKAAPEKIHKLWEGLGYYTRVRNMQKAAQFIVSESRRRGDGFQTDLERADKSVLRAVSPPPGPLPWGEGETLSRVQKDQRTQTQSDACRFPNSFDEVLALPGIGRYTAGAICSIAFDQPMPILDGNVIRVLTRVFGIAENPKEKTANAKLWDLAQELVLHAKRNTQHASPCSHLNQSLMELGALICTPREPKCLVCPISKHCFAFQNNRVSDFPNLEKRAAPTQRRFAAFVLENRGKFLVRQRPEGVVNGHLWEFPNIELNGAPTDPTGAARELFGVAPKEIKPLCTIKHSITRYRITVEAFRAETSAAAASRLKAELRTQWLPLSELHQLSFPSAHKKILKALDQGVVADVSLR